MTKLHAVLLTAALGLSIAGCKKETAITGISITATNFTSLADAMDKAQVPAQTFNVNAALGLQFRGSRGSRFVFPPNAFITPTGQPVTGTVQVAVREFLIPSDAIFSRVLPVTTTGSFYSGGMVWAFATQSGRTVLLRDGAPYTVYMPQRFGASALPVLNYHIGVPRDSSGALSVVNFVQDAGGSVVVPTSPFPPNLPIDTAILTTDSFAYVAAGLPVGFPDDDTVNIALTGVTLTGPQAAVYAIPRGANTVLPIQPFTGSRKDRYIIGETVWHFVAMTVVDGRFYGGITTVEGTRTRTGSTYTIALTETTPGELKTKIDALP